MQSLLRGLLAACVAWACSTALGQARWPDERQAGPFLCHADFSLAPHEGVIQQIAELEQEVTRTLQLPRSREEMHLFLFARESTYHAYLGRHFPQAPSRRALFIKGRGPGMVFAHANSEFAVDVRHECTHAVLHSVLPLVPLWLDEGLAEYFEAPAADRPSGNPHLRGVKWSLYVGGVKSMEQLEQYTDLQDLGAAEYRHAWAWVHFMLHGPPEARLTLQQYLADLEAGVPSAALSERLRERMADPRARLVEHFRNWK